MLTKRISPSMVVAMIALVAALTGTGLAATGQLVNIADGRTAANLATVDSSGALKTFVSGNVSVRLIQPATPFDAAIAVPNFWTNGRQVVFQTSAQLAITRLNYTNDVHNSSPWEIYVRYAPVTTSGCDAFAAGSRQISRASLPPGESYSDTFPSPIVLKPAAGTQQWCLVASAAPPSSSSPDSTSVGLDLSGFVIAGAFTPPPSKPTDAPTVGG